jgi:hypothetical protein
MLYQLSYIPVAVAVGIEPTRNGLEPSPPNLGTFATILVRPAGLEPAFSRWQRDVLPLDDGSKTKRAAREGRPSRKHTIGSPYERVPQPQNETMIDFIAGSVPRGTRGYKIPGSSGQIRATLVPPFDAHPDNKKRPISRALSDLRLEPLTGFEPATC